jgi:hypothetical protein
MGRAPKFAGQLRDAAATLIAFGVLGLQLACAGSTGPPAQTSVTVSVTPASANVFLGATQQFQSMVSGSSNTAVEWEVNGVAGGAPGTGTISSTGFYTAPTAMPAGGRVTIGAVSSADTADSGSASVTLEDDISISVAPPTANVPTGGAQVFTATTTASGDPAAGFTWSVSGIAGGNSTVGTIVTTSATTALYTAPAAVPSPASVIVTATSAADGTKSGSATATITCAATDSIAPSTASVGLGASQTFTASLCVPAGSALAWDVNGIAGGSAAVGTIAPSRSATAIYMAPTDLPATNPVTIHAAVNPPPAGGAEVAAATVTITSGVTVSVAPSTATIATGQRTSFSATVTNTADTTVTWSVAGVANGNASVGKICTSGSNPCVPPSGASAGSVDVLAPASAPAVNPELVTATSHADTSKSGAATVTISGATGSVSVSITPAYAFVVPSSGLATSTFQFSALVSGSANTAVNWSVASAVAGQGCGGTACGLVNAGGLYSAPAAAPSPNAILVTATSQADPTKSAAATIAISSGPMIEVILPSSVMAGAAEGFPLELQGGNFAAGSGSNASTILINGVARATTCSTGAQCVTTLNPSDVASAGSLTVEVQNPGNPGALSNPVPLVIVPFDVSVGTIALSAGQPVAGANTIVVVEPTTAAASSPINVNFVGMLTGGNTCGAQGSPLTIARPASGTETVSICVQGDGLDPSFNYSFTGPGEISSSGASEGDIEVTASAVQGLFPGMIELDLQISSATLPGVRSLFITTLNNDQAVATGMLEVQ